MLGGLPCTVYHPPGPPAGTILTVHGASPLGPHDPRWVQLCRGLAGAGFTALAPMYPTICRLRISADQPDRVAETLQDATRRFGGPPGMLSVSFSGGVTLLAAARVPSGPILTIGTYGQASRALQLLLEDPDADWYGVLIAMAHYSETAPLRAALLAVAEDDFHSHPSRPQHYRSWLSAAEAEKFDALVSCGDARRALLGPHLDDRDPTLAALDATAALPHLSAPLTLVHGRDDRVIPATESAALHALGRRLGRADRLVVTPLVSHGDAQRSLLATAWHAPRLIGAIRAWMRAVAGHAQRA